MPETTPPSPDRTEHSRSEPTRLAAVSYLNTRPLIDGLEHERSVELATRPPASVIDLLRPDPTSAPEPDPGPFQSSDASQGSPGPLVDLALVSLVDVLRARGELTLVPAGMIASDGPTHTVRLFSRVPIDQIRVVHADPESHTSVLLARLILAERSGARPEIRDLGPDERAACDADADTGTPGAPEAVLLIGDKVVTSPPCADRYPHQLDLGEAWRELTGLPFVYAVWACRTADADPDHPEHDPAAHARVRRGALLLDRQRRHNATRLDWIVGHDASAHGWPAEPARRYVGTLLRYSVDARARAGVAEFVRRLTLAEPGVFTAPPWGDALLAPGPVSVPAAVSTTS